MKSIYKYVLNIEDEPVVLMPAGAEVLSVNTQLVRGFETLCIWALVDPTAPEEGRRFRIYGTGHPVEEADLANSKFIGTTSMRRSALIWHIFEAGPSNVWAGMLEHNGKPN